MKNPFKALFSKTITFQEGDMTVQIQEGDTMYETLFMTEERSDELLNEVLRFRTEQLDKRGEVVKQEEAAHISKFCKHPNELAMCCMFIGEIFVKHQQMQSQNNLLSKFFGM